MMTNHILHIKYRQPITTDEVSCNKYLLPPSCNILIAMDQRREFLSVNWKQARVVSIVFIFMSMADGVQSTSDFKLLLFEDNLATWRRRHLQPSIARGR